MATELAFRDSAYEELALKFFEHFLAIAHAMSHRGRDGMSLWDETDGFFYDVVRDADGRERPLKVRSIVGLIPILATEVGDPAILDRLPDLHRRIQWFRENRPDQAENVAPLLARGQRQRLLASVVKPEQLRRILRIMLDENEFLSPYGIRSVSKVHQKPYTVSVAGVERTLDYEPGESTTGLFGGNSNWRGPIWMPLNYLLIEALQRFDHYLGSEFTVECPTGSGQIKTLWEVAVDLSHRLTRIFLRDADGRRPVNGAQSIFERDPLWRDLVLFYEYFHGEDGHGLGASHQTGWTALIAKLLQQSGATLAPASTPAAATTRADTTVAGTTALSRSASRGAPASPRTTGAPTAVTAPPAAARTASRKPERPTADAAKAASPKSAAPPPAAPPAASRKSAAPPAAPAATSPKAAAPPAAPAAPPPTLTGPHPGAARAGSPKRAAPAPAPSSRPAAPPSAPVAGSRQPPAGRRKPAR
jgi:hypothetical protein